MGGIEIMVDNAHTVLVLNGIGVQPYSARGLTQTLQPIGQAAVLARTINGGLRDLAFDGFKKYASVISGNDQAPPVCDGLWPGRQVTVDCIAKMSVPDNKLPARPIVPGSDYQDGGKLIYRPRLTMMVLSFNMNTDEWQAGVSWSLNLEEI